MNTTTSDRSDRLDRSDRSDRSDQSASVQAAQSAQSRGERGQTTAEYALVLLAAGTVAMLVVAWAQDNGAVGEFLDQILDKITSLIE